MLCCVDILFVLLLFCLFTHSFINLLIRSFIDEFIFYWFFIIIYLCGMSSSHSDSCRVGGYCTESTYDILNGWVKRISISEMEVQGETMLCQCPLFSLSWHCVWSSKQCNASSMSIKTDVDDKIDFRKIDKGELVRWRLDRSVAFCFAFACHRSTVMVYRWL